MAKTFRNAELQFIDACLIHGEIEVSAPRGLNDVPPSDNVMHYDVPPSDNVMHLGYQLEPRVGKSHDARSKYIPTLPKKFTDLQLASALNKKQ